MNKFILVLAVSTLWITDVAADEWIIRDAAIMGTTIHVEVWHENVKIAEQAADRVISVMEEINQRMSPYLEDSELSLINREASQRPISISDDLYLIIERSLDYSIMTSGAFDITFASVGYLYDYRNAIRPGSLQISERLEGINFQHISLNNNDRTISLSKVGVPLV